MCGPLTVTQWQWHSDSDTVAQSVKTLHIISILKQSSNFSWNAKRNVKGVKNRGHSSRLNAEVVARAWKILSSLVVGVNIILQIVLPFFMCLVRNLQKNGKNVQNQSGCDSALRTALTNWRSDMCDFSSYFWRLSWSILRFTT